MILDRKVSNCMRVNRVMYAPRVVATCCCTCCCPLRFYILHSGCPSKLPTQLVPLWFCGSAAAPITFRVPGDRLNYSVVQRHSMMTAA